MGGVIHEWITYVTKIAGATALDNGDVPEVRMCCERRTEP